MFSLRGTRAGSRPLCASGCCNGALEWIERLYDENTGQSRRLRKVAGDPEEEWGVPGAGRRTLS